MPVRFVDGDLFEHPGLEALAHGCNCAGAMGKGIAAGLGAKTPVELVVFEEYAPAAPAT